MVLLLILVASNPQLSCLFLIVDHLRETLDTIVELVLGQVEGLLSAEFLGLESCNLVRHLVYALV